MAYELVYTHSEIIEEIAQQLLESSSVGLDPRLVQVACLLHDIGAYQFITGDGEFDFANYFKHGIVGEDILRRHSFSEVLCRIPSHHTGSGITKEEVINQQLPLPPQDYMADTQLERLVMYADKFQFKDNAFNSLVICQQRMERFGDTQLQRFNRLVQEFGEPKLEELAAKYKQSIR